MFSAVFSVESLLDKLPRPFVWILWRGNGGASIGQADLFCIAVPAIALVGGRRGQGRNNFDQRGVSYGQLRRAAGLRCHHPDAVLRPIIQVKTAVIPSTHPVQFPHGGCARKLCLQRLQIGQGNVNLAAFCRFLCPGQLAAVHILFRCLLVLCYNPALVKKQA